MASLDLPYRSEYAKSGRASCKACKGIISKDTLRMAQMVQVFICIPLFHIVVTAALALFSPSILTER